MADPEIVMDPEVEVADEEMGEAEGAATNLEDAAAADAGEPSGLEDIEPTIPTRTSFADYLQSPIVNLVVGPPEAQSTLHAHQALLQQSPFLAEQCTHFTPSQPSRSIALPSDDLAAVASVLEYLYRADYFPVLSGSQAMEYDPTVPDPDHAGVALLRHARVYTLAQRFSLPQLAALAHKKIHLTQSTAKGEIAYARFVYSETDVGDKEIRKPVAAFWATRSHVLRHEAEAEFRRMCLDFPVFGFDVLSLVLDAQEKRSLRQEAQSSGGSSRKRARVSVVS